MGIEKGAVLQEARVFNDPQLDPRKCSQVNDSALPKMHVYVLSTYMRCYPIADLGSLFMSIQVITKLLYLLNQGESFTKVGFFLCFIFSILFRSHVRKHSLVSSDQLLTCLRI